MNLFTNNLPVPIQAKITVILDYSWLYINVKMASKFHFINFIALIFVVKCRTSLVFVYWIKLSRYIMINFDLWKKGKCGSTFCARTICPYICSFIFHIPTNHLTFLARWRLWNDATLKIVLPHQTRCKVVWQSVMYKKNKFI